MADKKDIKPSSSADLLESLEKLKASLKKHASVIFIIAILGAVVYSVSAVNIILNTPSDENYRTTKEAELTGTQFNRTTIEKIEALGERDDPPAPRLPDGRINPFVE